MRRVAILAQRTGPCFLYIHFDLGFLMPCCGAANMNRWIDVGLVGPAIETKPPSTL